MTIMLRSRVKLLKATGGRTLQPNNFGDFGADGVVSSSGGPFAVQQKSSLIHLQEANRDVYP